MNLTPETNERSDFALEWVCAAEPFRNATDAPTTTFAPEPPVLDHERLDVYRVALEFAAMVPALTKSARPSLRDQLERASSSVVLTLAEGCGRRTRRDRLHFFSMAQGSAMECAAAIDLLRVNVRCWWA